MTPLARAIAEIIRRDGPLPVERYMQLCLFHPEHGYYRTRQPIGTAGDFITAPEISQMFGELLGLWAAEVWSAMGKPRPVHLVELGPGRGTLMGDALRAVAKAAPDFRAALNVHLVEVHPGLRERQAAALPDARPSWHGDLGSVPNGPLIVLANEFFDALPTRQLVRHEGEWRERMVGLEGEQLRFTLGPTATADDLSPAEDGQIVELSPAREAYAATLARRLAAEGGAALVIDYGAPVSGVGDTLQAVQAQKKVDPLAEPGLADLTTHVDFAALARAARGAGAATYGAIPQGPFLQRLGIAARAVQLAQRATDRQREDIAAAVRRLIEPDEMGTLFQALALAHPSLPAPPGFDAC